MKLDYAYLQWGQIKENETLFIKTRQQFRKVWWLIPTNQPCSYYTLPVLGRALQQANAAQGDKVQAASVMVHVLNYAHQQEPDLNPAPTFTHSDIVNFDGLHPSPMVQAIEQHEAEKAEKAEVKVKPEAQAKRLVELAKRDGGLAATKAAKSVLQLDAKTLKVIKVWPSCFAAQKELGIKNVQRAINRCGLSAGYYWCRPGDEVDFKPADKRSKNGAKKADKPKPIPKIEYKPTEEDRELMKRVFDDPNRQPSPEQQEQLKEAEVAVAEARQDFEEEIANHVEGVLQHCSQDELIAELRRRSWKGVLHITQTIEL